MVLIQSLNSGDSVFATRRQLHRIDIKRYRGSTSGSTACLRFAGDRVLDYRGARFDIGQRELGARFRIGLDRQTFGVNQFVVQI